MAIAAIHVPIHVFFAVPFKIKLLKYFVALPCIPILIGNLIPHGHVYSGTR